MWLISFIHLSISPPHPPPPWPKKLTLNKSKRRKKSDSDITTSTTSWRILTASPCLFTLFPYLSPPTHTDNTVPHFPPLHQRHHSFRRTYYHSMWSSCLINYSPSSSMFNSPPIRYGVQYKTGERKPQNAHHQTFLLLVSTQNIIDYCCSPPIHPSI